MSSERDLETGLKEPPQQETTLTEGEEAETLLCWGKIHILATVLHVWEQS